MHFILKQEDIISSHFLRAFRMRVALGAARVLAFLHSAESQFIYRLKKILITCLIRYAPWCNICFLQVYHFSFVVISGFIKTYLLFHYLFLLISVWSFLNAILHPCNFCLPSLDLAHSTSYLAYSLILYLPSHSINKIFHTYFLY